MTTQKPFLGLRGQTLSWALALCCGSSFLLFGYDQGIMGSIVSTPYFLDAIHVAADDAQTLSTIVSVYEIGNMVGCVLTGLKIGHYGRKTAIYTGCSIAIVGALLQATSYSVAQMIAARVICGVGNGINTATIPTWVAETAKPKTRGRLIASQLSTAVFGSAIAYWMNYGFFHLKGQIVWRFPIAFQVVFALVTLFGLPFLPESPRYLYSKGRTEEADIVLAALTADDIDSESVQAARAEILGAIALEDHLGEYSVKSIFRDKSGQKIPRRLLLAAVIQILQEMTGLQIVVNYSSSIFINLGIEGDLALIFGGVIAVVFFIGTVIGVVIIDHVPRKKLLYSGTIPVFILYVVYMFMVKNGGRTQLWVAFVATCLIMLSFGWSWLPGSWLLGPELVPVRYRHIGGAISAFAFWTTAFITVKIGPPGLQQQGWKLYIVFIVFTFIQLPIVYFFYPETGGLSLEEIDELFVGPQAALAHDMAMTIETEFKASNEVQKVTINHVDNIKA